MANFRFRLAEDSDYSKIENLWVEGIKQIYGDITISEEIIELFKYNFKNRKNIYNFWVAELSYVIGWCSVLPAFSHPFKQKTDCEISTYIDMEFSNIGIGTHLMKFVFNELENKEVKNVFGFVNPKNIKSIKMSKNAGMRICGHTSTKVILIKEYK